MSNFNKARIEKIAYLKEGQPYLFYKQGKFNNEVVQFDQPRELLYIVGLFVWLFICARGLLDHTIFLCSC